MIHHNFSYVEVVEVVVVVVLRLHMSGSEFVEMEMLLINLQSLLLNVQVYISKAEGAHRLIINICHEVGDGKADNFH